MFENYNEYQDGTSQPAKIDNLFELGALLFAGLLAGKTVSNKITDGHRREILDKLPMQNLGWLATVEIRNYFRSKKFYVTQFPDTHPKVFPNAAKLIYSLLLFHGNRREDVLLKWKLQFQIKNFIICQQRALGHEAPQWDDSNVQKLLSHNPTWNLADFLNSQEIRNLIFGIKKDKRIDVAIYQSKMFGHIQNVSGRAGPLLVRSPLGTTRTTFTICGSSQLH
jgi:hypothetical protein